MSRRPKNEPTRPDPDRRRTARLQDFYLLDRIQRRLKKMRNSPVISDEQLVELSIASSSAFDIEQDDPIDAEPRYFLPGPVEAMERALSMVPLDWQRFIRTFRPIEYHSRTRYDGFWHNEDLWRAIDAVGDASSMGRHFFFTVVTTTAWHQWEFPGQYLPGCSSTWELPNGQVMSHRFESSDFFHRTVVDEEGLPELDPNLPHTMAVVADSFRPRDNNFLRSELLMAIALIKTQVRKLDEYLDHHVFPALVLSFHGRFTARILQAHLYNGRLVVRASRLIQLHTPHMTTDIQLLLRCYNSIPVGETRYLPLNPTVTRSEGGAVHIYNQEHPEVVSRPTIQAAE